MSLKKPAIFFCVINPTPILTLIIALAVSLTGSPLLAAEKDPHKPFNWMERLASLPSSESIEKEILSVITIENHTGIGFVLQDDKTGKFILITTFDAIKDADPSNLKFMNQGNPLKIKRIWSASIEQNVISFELEDYKGYALKPPDSPNYNSDRVYIPGHPDAHFSDIKGASLHNTSSLIFGVISDETVDLLQKEKGGGPVLNSKGEVIGMYLQKDITTPGVYFAVKIEHLQDLLHNPKISVDNPDDFLTKDSFEKQIEILQLLFSFNSDVNDFYFNKGTDVTEYFSGEAFSRLKDIADKGSANAQFKTGWQLSFGHGIPQNKEQAAFWLGQAAGQEHPEAKHIHIAEIKNRSAQFREARTEGWIAGTYLMAQKLYKGDGIPQDKEKAAGKFEIVATHHSLIEGLKDFAKFMFSNTNNKPIEDDSNELSKTDPNSPKDDLEEWVIRYIKQGGTSAKPVFTLPYQYEAIFRVAVMSYKGDGIPQRKKVAFFWFSKIVESYHSFLDQQSEVALQETDNDLEYELFERLMLTGEEGLEELIETSVDQNRFEGLMKIAAKQSQMEELSNIQNEIEEIAFAARHKMIVMLKTGDDIPLNKKAADQFLNKVEQRTMTQKEWNYIAEPDDITEMKKRIREVKNSIIPEIDTENRAETIMERIHTMEEIERITQGTQPKGDESPGSSCKGTFKPNGDQEK